jgi:serpin B
VTDDLRVRSEPRVADDSVKFVPTLREGTELVVIAGPVRASGYTWVKVAPVGVNLRGGSGQGSVAVDQGWVAVADHDGTPWVGPAKDPTPGYELAGATMARTRPTLAAARDAAAAQNAFGIDLYRRMLRDPNLGLAGKGVVMSPTSIVMALAMARAGAKGDTAAEMDDVLGLAGWERYATSLGALDQELRSRDATWSRYGGEQHALALRMANMAFGQRGYAIEPTYLDRIGAAFGSPLALVDYRGDPGAALDAINGWVSRQTLGRIPKLLSPANIHEATRLVLVNAVYLKAEWAMPFIYETEARPFTTMSGEEVSVPTMRQDRAALPVAEGPGWRATELRYAAPEGVAPLSMTLVLPDDIDAFERSLKPSVIAAIDSKLKTEWNRVTKVRYGNPDQWGQDCGTVAYTTNLFLPKFGIDTRGDLVPALGAAGMQVPMSPAADFTGINDAGLFIAVVIHQANIDVDEKGTEAAAATAVGMDTTGGCGGPTPKTVRTLRLNRPFVFLLRDTGTGAILFMGRVANPLVRS